MEPRGPGDKDPIVPKDFANARLLLSGGTLSTDILSELDKLGDRVTNAKLSEIGKAFALPPPCKPTGASALCF